MIELIRGVIDMELEGKDLFCYQLLEGYGKNASKYSREDPILDQWIEEIKRDAPAAWNAAKEKYSVFENW